MGKELNTTYINKGTNIIQMITREEHIKETFQNALELWKRVGMWYGKETNSKTSTKAFLFLSK